MSILKSKLTALLVVVPAASFASYQTSYTVKRPLNDDFEITNIFMLERGPGGGSGTWAFQVDQGQPEVTLTNPFLKDVLPTESLLVGITHDLPGDAAGQKHIVLMMDDTAAQLSNHIAWGTLFRNTDEDQLIADIELGSSGQDWPIIQPGLDGLNRFTSGTYDPFGMYHPSDAEAGILGPGGILRSAWFRSGGSFTVVAWSDGQIVGTGQSHFTPVPEPATMAALGLGVVGLIKRRRR